MLNRRNFLKNTSLLAAGGLLAGNVNDAKATNAFDNTQASTTKNFGLQIYSLTVRNGQEFTSDVAGGLKRVAQMGYTSLELAGYTEKGLIGQVPMAEFKKYADNAGLTIASSHINPPIREYTKESIETGKEFWKRVCEHHASIGCKYVIIPGQPSTRSTEEVAMVGEGFNEFGKISKEAGLQFAFHNHSNEFRNVVPGGTEMMAFGTRQRTEGIKMVYDGMIEATDPSLVQFELDVYWTVMGMQDPVAYMKKYPNRIRVLHIKDVDILGESGMMNFQKIFETAYAHGIANFFVELEGFTVGTQFEGVKGCADYLLRSPFVR